MNLEEKKALLEFVVTLVGYASIVSAAIFGMIGLFAEYKVDGKTTVWGKVAAVGIALSAAFGLTSAVLQRRADAAHRELSRIAADDERRKSEKQYREQVGRLFEINRTVAGVNETSATLLKNMGTSLEAQDRMLTDQRRLLANARESMLMTSRLQSQQRRGTTKVLRGLWNEANRVSGATIVAAVAYNCSVGWDAYFPILPEEGRAQLTLVPMAKVAAEGVPLTRFRAGYVQGSVDLTAIDQRTTLHREPTGEVGFQQISRFSPFAFGADDLEALSSPENWDGMAVELMVVGVQPDLAQRMAAVASRPVRGRDALAEKYDLSAGVAAAPGPDDDGARVAVMPCQADMFLFINDRQVAEAQGLVVQLWDRPGDRIGRIIVKFPIVAVDTDDFPRFAEASSGR